VFDRSENSTAGLETSETTMTDVDNSSSSIAELLELSNDLKKISIEKGRFIDKIETIAEICRIFEKLLLKEEIRPRLVTLGKSLSTVIADCLDVENEFSSYLKSLTRPSVDGHYHIFIVTLFSASISKGLNWSSRRTLESLIYAALVHDIGECILKINEFPLDDKTWTPEQKELYQQHPKEGFVFLDHFQEVSEPVKQIVYQHHEYVNGTGFPESLAGNKIYPLAKILTISNEFAHLLETRDISPVEGLKEFLGDRNALDKFEPEIVKALIKSFIRADKKV
jgi:HD-GYP domain-containing protein (c-di-GMP phosphodiesterase class II)